MLFKNEEGKWSIDNILVRAKDIGDLMYLIVMSDDVFGAYTINPNRTKVLVYEYARNFINRYKRTCKPDICRVKLAVNVEGNINKNCTSSRTATFFSLQGIIEHTESRLVDLNTFRERYQIGCFTKNEYIYLVQKMVELVKSNILSELFILDKRLGGENV